MADVILYPRTIDPSEILQHDFDFTDALPSGVTLSSAVATHTPPAGGTPATPTVGSPSGAMVPVTLGPLSAAEAGVNYLSCLATLSNGNKPLIVIEFPVSDLP